MTYEGVVEQLTLSSNESDRYKKYHIALVSVPGKDMYEVGLQALFHKLGVEALNPSMVSDLMLYKHETVCFDGCEITYPINLHKIELTPESAEEWVNRYNV